MLYKFLLLSWHIGALMFNIFLFSVQVEAIHFVFLYLCSAVCGSKVFTIVHTCWNSWYCINMPTRLFSVQRHTGCFLQNHSTGWWVCVEIYFSLCNCSFNFWLCCFVIRLLYILFSSNAKGLK